MFADGDADDPNCQRAIEAFGHFGYFPATMIVTNAPVEISVSDRVPANAAAIVVFVSQGESSMPKVRGQGGYGGGRSAFVGGGGDREGKGNCLRSRREGEGCSARVCGRIGKSGKNYRGNGSAIGGRGVAGVAKTQDFAGGDCVAGGEGNFSECGGGRDCHGDLSGCVSIIGNIRGRLRRRMKRRKSRSRWWFRFIGGFECEGGGRSGENYLHGPEFRAVHRISAGEQYQSAISGEGGAGNGSRGGVEVPGDG